MKTREEWIQWCEQTKKEAEAFACKFSNAQDPTAEKMRAQFDKVIAALDNVRSTLHSFDDEEYAKLTNTPPNMKTKFREI